MPDRARRATACRRSMTPAVTCSAIEKAIICLTPFAAPLRLLGDRGGGAGGDRGDRRAPWRSRRRARRPGRRARSRRRPAAPRRSPRDLAAGARQRLLRGVLDRRRRDSARRCPARRRRRCCRRWRAARSASDTSTPRVRSLTHVGIFSVCGAPIRVRVELASVKGQCVGGEQMRVEPCQQRRRARARPARRSPARPSPAPAGTCGRRGNRDRA